MKKSTLKKLLAKCRITISKHPERNNFPHWSFILIDDNIISSGINLSVEPPVYYGYHNHHIDETFIPKIHSELSAILKCKKIPNSFSCVNIRLNKKGQTRLSMPCKICRKILKNFGCKKVWFTLENDIWGNLNF